MIWVVRTLVIASVTSAVDELKLRLPARAPSVRLPRRPPKAAPKLLPLALAWRSLLAYFVWLPALALLAALPRLATEAAAQPSAVAGLLGGELGGAAWRPTVRRLGERVDWFARSIRDAADPSSAHASRRDAA